MFHKKISISYFALALLAGELTLSQTAYGQESEAVKNEAVKNAVDLVNQAVSEIGRKIPAVDAYLIDKSINTFTPEETIVLVDNITKRYKATMSPEQLNKLTESKTLLVQLLQQYKVSGFSFCIDPNGAFFVDEQNPEFKVYYKNDKGELKHRQYEASINSIGLKIHFSLNFNFIFFVGTDFNHFDSNKRIELGNGIDLTVRIPYRSISDSSLNKLNQRRAAFNLPPLIANHVPLRTFPINFTYVSFKNTTGGMIIIGYPFGLANYLSWQINRFLKFPDISMVTGGTLTPKNS